MAFARFHWLLEVEAGGPTYRWSVEDLVVLSADGTEYVYSQGLKDLEMAQGDVDDVAIEILEGSVMDWPAIGPLLDGSRCILRRWREGTVLERAEVYARGTVTEPEWGGVYDEAQWTILPVENLPAMPDPGAKVSPITTFVDDATDTTIPPGQTGMYYPVVFGFPGRLIRQYVGVESGLLYGDEPVVPCPMRIQFLGALTFADSQIVVSHDAGACLPDQVEMREDASGLVVTLECIAATDELGRRIAVATMTDPRIFPLGDDEPQYYCSLSADSGGLAAPRSAYDVIAYVLDKWGGDTVDHDRIPEVREHLQGFLVDTYVNELVEGGVWAWLVEALGVAEAGSSEAAGLPVAIRTGAGGRYLVPLRYSIDPARTIRVIDVARGEASRVNALRQRGSPLNVLELTYGYDLSIWAGEVAGNIPAVIGATSTVGTSTLTATAPSSLARESVARYGVRPATIEVPWTWDAATVVRISEVLLARDAIPWRTVQYRVPEEWGLREGDQVLIRDPEVALDEHAIVDGPPYISAEGMTVTLRMPGARGQQ